MSTRTILTLPPVQSCEVCSRRLLRGEHAEVFIQAGQRRTVCELCAPRASDAGWTRERELDLDALSEPRERPSRGLFGRLLRSIAQPPAARPGTRAEDAEPEQPTDEHQSAPAIAREPAGAFQEHLQPPSPSLLESAVSAFNASEYPRRVRGVARSLGQPEVSVRPAEHLDGAVTIVVAWELCWYRYEIDFGEPEPSVRALAQGSELAQLEREERDFNAILTAEGALALAAVA